MHKLAKMPRFSLSFRISVWNFCHLHILFFYHTVSPKCQFTNMIYFMLTQVVITWFQQLHLLKTTSSYVNFFLTESGTRKCSSVYNIFITVRVMDCISLNLVALKIQSLCWYLTGRKCCEINSNAIRLQITRHLVRMTNNSMV